MYDFNKLQNFHWHQHQPASSQWGEPLFLPTVNSVVNQALHSNRWNRPQHHSPPAFTTYLTLCWNHAFICCKKSGQMFWFSLKREGYSAKEHLNMPTNLNNPGRQQWWCNLKPTWHWELSNGSKLGGSGSARDRVSHVINFCQPLRVIGCSSPIIKWNQHRSRMVIIRHEPVGRGVEQLRQFAGGLNVSLAWTWCWYSVSSRQIDPNVDACGNHQADGRGIKWRPGATPAWFWRQCWCRCVSDYNHLAPARHEAAVNEGDIQQGLNGWYYSGLKSRKWSWIGE